VSVRLSRRPLVRRVVAGRSHFERGGPEVVTGPRVALLAHWSPRARVTRSFATLVHELQVHGYRVVVSSTCEVPGALEWPEEVDVDLEHLSVIRRPNVGYDFGSWSVALELVPEAAAAERTIVANDSMAGPFRTLRPFLEAFDATGVDVWALTDTQQSAPHLQSYFLGFCDGVLQERPLARFWERARCEPAKDQVIHRYELGLSRLLQHEGFVHRPHFSHELVVRGGENPVINGWRRLLELGFPFVKREILRDPDVVPAGHTVPMYVRRQLGVEVAEWVDEPVVG
jgi:lipopolysaccharide biosynthesis protein